MNYKHTKAGCYIGFTVQAIINNFLPILFIVFQKNYALSYEKLGRIVFINFFTQIFSDLATPYITRLIGYRKTAVLCHLLSAAGLIMLGVLPVLTNNFYLTVVSSVIVYALGSGIIEVILTPIVDLLPSKNPFTSMVFTHSFYCWGQAFTVIVTTLLVITLGFARWNLIPLIWSTVPLFNMIFFTKVPIIEPKASPKGKSQFDLFTKKEFWCFAIFMVCAGVSEMVMSEWTSVFAQNSLKVSKLTGDLMGPCAFALFMGAGRIFYGSISSRVSLKKIMILNNLLCFACYFLVGISNLPFLSLICCGLCGFGVSVSWPGTYSLAARKFPAGGTLMFSIYALCGDMGCSFGPWLLGCVADKMNIKSGFIVCSAFPLIMIIAALLLFEEKDCKDNATTV